MKACFAENLKIEGDLLFKAKQFRLTENNVNVYMHMHMLKHI